MNTERAEISRQNGAKSRGAVSQRGKAISSQNATKHGLLSNKSPLLISENLTLFESILQGLTEDYQPQSTIENLLIQQAAMGWLRLWRLWTVEAATINSKLLDR